jgi:hypothetical protein
VALSPFDRADNSDVFLAGHGVLLVLFKLPAQADPVGCSGQEHGRSIPFASFRCGAEFGRYRRVADIGQARARRCDALSSGLSKFPNS